MLTRVSKEFHWEMSHRLPRHAGLCKNIHGHTYRLRLDLFGTPDECGIVVDFFDIDRIMRPIIDRLDHAFLCEKSDTLILDFLQANNFKCEILDAPTTSENIVVYLADLAEPKFRALGNISRMTIRVYETIGVFAEITREI